ncbi:MAG: autoinducer binding domain-containing protein [Litorimonas sp.]
MRELPIGDALEAFEASDTEERAFEALIAFAESIGADLLSYHHVEPSLRQATSKPGSADFTLSSHGFPDAWVKKYESSDYRRIDPITAYAAYQTRPVLWSDIPRRVEMSAEQTAYIDDLYSWLSPGDGLAVPLFGPSGRHGYGGIGWRKPTVPPWTPVKQRGVQSVFESFHLRVCELRLAQMDPAVQLRPRQAEMLRLMARGYPDALICDRLDLRLEAFRIELSRLLRALDVTDRPSAMLRAQALGLLEQR